MKSDLRVSICCRPADTSPSRAGLTPAETRADGQKLCSFEVLSSKKMFSCFDVSNNRGSASLPLSWKVSLLGMKPIDMGGHPNSGRQRTF